MVFTSLTFQKKLGGALGTEGGDPQQSCIHLPKASSRSRPISNINPSKKLNFLHFQASWFRGWWGKEACREGGKKR